MKKKVLCVLGILSVFAFAVAGIVVSRQAMTRREFEEAVLNIGRSY